MSYSTLILKDNPMAVWALDETSGSLAYSTNLLSSSYTGSYSSNPPAKSSLPIVFAGDSALKMTSTASGLKIPLLNKFSEGLKQHECAIEFFLRLEETPDVESVICKKTGANWTTGLYVNQSHLIFRVGTTSSYYETSVYVDNFYQPLHVVMNYSDDNIQLIVNGKYSNTRINNSVIEYDASHSTNNFLEFYGISKNIVNIDTVAIYSKNIDPIIAKTHYFYALGKPVDQNVFRSLGGDFYKISTARTRPSSRIEYDAKDKWIFSSNRNIYATDDGVTLAQYTEPRISSIDNRYVASANKISFTQSGSTSSATYIDIIDTSNLLSDNSGIFGVFNFTASYPNNNIYSAGLWSGSAMAVINGYPASVSMTQAITTGPFGTPENVITYLVTSSYTFTGAGNGIYFPATSSAVSSRVTVSPKSTYRFSYWVKGLKAQSGVYIGLGADVTGSYSSVFSHFNGTNATSNYYFAVFDATTIPNVTSDEWLLVVGYLYPHDATIETTSGGVYNTSGQRVYSFPNARFYSDRTRTVFGRFFTVDGTLGRTMSWARTRVDLIDGTEPSVLELLNNSQTLMSFYDSENKYINLNLEYLSSSWCIVADSPAFRESASTISKKIVSSNIQVDTGKDYIVGLQKNSSSFDIVAIESGQTASVLTASSSQSLNSMLPSGKKSFIRIAANHPATISNTNSTSSSITDTYYAISGIDSINQFTGSFSRFIATGSYIPQISSYSDISQFDCNIFDFYYDSTKSRFMTKSNGEFSIILHGTLLGNDPDGTQIINSNIVDIGYPKVSDRLNNVVFNGMFLNGKNNWSASNCEWFVDTQYGYESFGSGTLTSLNASPRTISYSASSINPSTRYRTRFYYKTNSSGSIVASVVSYQNVLNLQESSFENATVSAGKVGRLIGGNGSTLTSVVSRNDAPHGSSALQVTVTGGASYFNVGNINSGDWIPVSPSEVWTVRAVTLSSSAASGTGTYQARLVWYDSSSVVLSINGGNTVTLSPSAWQVAQVTASAPVSAAYMRCDLFSTVQPLNTVVFVDGFEIYNDATAASTSLISSIIPDSDWRSQSLDLITSSTANTLRVTIGASGILSTRYISFDNIESYDVLNDTRDLISEYSIYNSSTGSISVDPKEFKSYGLIEEINNVNISSSYVKFDFTLNASDYFLRKPVMKYFKMRTYDNTGSTAINNYHNNPIRIFSSSLSNSTPLPPELDLPPLILHNNSGISIDSNYFDIECDNFNITNSSVSPATRTLGFFAKIPSSAGYFIPLWNAYKYNALPYAAAGAGEGNILPFASDGSASISSSIINIGGDAYNGYYSIYASVTSSVSNTMKPFYLITYIPVVKNGSYTFSYRIYGNIPNVASARARIVWYKSDLTYFDATDGAYASVSNGSWTLITASFNPPASAYYARPEMDIYSSSFKLSEVYYIDDIYFGDNSNILDSDKNSADYEFSPSWVLGSTGNQNSLYGTVSQNGNSYENRIIYDYGPYMSNELLWETPMNEPSTGTVLGADGGWNTPGLTIDHETPHEISTWFQWFGNSTGNLYFGTSMPSGVMSLNGASTTNPYFIYIPNPQALIGMKSGEWYKFVGYLYPRSTNLILRDASQNSVTASLRMIDYSDLTTFTTLLTTSTASGISGLGSTWTEVTTTDINGAVRGYTASTMLTASQYYICSIDVYNREAASVRLGLDFCDTGGRSWDIAAGASARIYTNPAQWITASPDTYRFFDIAFSTLQVSGSGKILLKNPKIELTTATGSSTFFSITPSVQNNGIYDLNGNRIYTAQPPYGDYIAKAGTDTTFNIRAYIFYDNDGKMGGRWARPAARKLYSQPNFSNHSNIIINPYNAAGAYLNTASTIQFYQSTGSVYVNGILSSSPKFDEWAHYTFVIPDTAAGPQVAQNIFDIKLRFGGAGNWTIDNIYTLDKALSSTDVLSLHKMFVGTSVASVATSSYGIIFNDMPETNHIVDANQTSASTYRNSVYQPFVGQKRYVGDVDAVSTSSMTSSVTSDVAYADLHLIRAGDTILDIGNHKLLSVTSSMTLQEISAIDGDYVFVINGSRYKATHFVRESGSWVESYIPEKYIITTNVVT